MTEYDYLPNLLIAGVNKAGTTSLHNYLDDHPDIFGTPVKETYYFNPLINNKALASLEYYRDFFKGHTNETYVLESTPQYIYGGKTTATKVQELLGQNVRVIIVLREPISRLFSFFKFKKRCLHLSSEVSFRDFVEGCLQMPDEEKKRHAGKGYRGIDHGMYADYLQEWFDVFGDNMRVYFFSHLKEEPMRVLKDISDWLGVDAGFYQNYQFKVDNPSRSFKNERLHRMALKIYRSFRWIIFRNDKLRRGLVKLYDMMNTVNSGELMEEEVKERLKNVYKEPNHRLYGLLVQKGYKDLPDWLVNSKYQ